MFAGERGGSALNRIELLAYLTDLDENLLNGYVPVDLSLFSLKEFTAAVEIMNEVFEADLSFSRLADVISLGEKLGGVPVPEGMVGLVTVSSVIINGSFLKAGIPVDSCFGGMLQVRDRKQLRFVDLIKYEGSSLHPYEIFIASRITDVLGVIRRGTGKVLASFHEIPMFSMPSVLRIIDRLKESGLCNTVTTGRPSGSVCEMPVRYNNTGLLLLGGLNPVAAAVEAGINVTCKAMSGIINVRRLKDFSEIQEEYGRRGG